MRDKEAENSICFLISVFPELLKSDFTLLAGSAQKRRRRFKKDIYSAAQVRFLAKQVTLQREKNFPGDTSKLFGAFLLNVNKVKIFDIFKYSYMKRTKNLDENGLLEMCESGGSTHFKFAPIRRKKNARGLKEPFSVS